MHFCCFYDQAKPLVCRKAPFKKLRLRSLSIRARRSAQPPPLYVFPDESALSLARNLASCVYLKELMLDHAPLHVQPVWEALSVSQADKIHSLFLRSQPTLGARFGSLAL